MKGENEMAEKVFSLINIDEVDKNIHKEFYPRISHVQRKKLIDCIKRSEVFFEDETGNDVTDLTPSDFEKLSETEKYLAYENMLMMFYGCLAELEELQESI